jgi:DNA repair protein RecN (Recombination protein N)
LPTADGDEPVLTELHIENFGVIDRLDLLLRPGFTVVTGETGAGKTMIVDAIELLTGGRADASAVRAGASEARVEGRFVIDDEEHVVARVIPAEGRARAYVDGRLATASAVTDLTARAVDIHGQHDHQRLMSTASQRSALDRWCNTDLSPLRAARAGLTEIDAALAALGGDSRVRAREIDLLTFQHQELSAAGLVAADEERVIDVEIDLLGSAVAHREAAQVAVELLIGDDGVADRLAEAIATLGRSVPFAALAEQLQSARESMIDVGHELRQLGETIDEDPARLDQLRERRAALRELRKKYGDSLADVIEFAASVRQRLDELGRYEQRVAELEQERHEASALERAAAAAVATTRRAGATTLAAQLEQGMRALAMPHARAGIVVSDDDPGDDVTILLAANPGGPLLPLQRVASGGELARTMLALRLVISDAPDTLLFDEVDAGIGGSAAVTVGTALSRLGAHHQVLVVTHLAQVAAGADTHLVVRKDVRDGQTFASVVAVRADERIEEVARMLSGELGGDPARSHAAALIAECSRDAV